jgi:hypothetical protein
LCGGYERVQSDVVIVGYRLNAKEPAQKALERILGLTPDAARALARSFPAVVVQGAANDNAERIRDQLESAGATVELRASEARIERSPRELAAPAKRGGAFDLDLDLPAPKAPAPNTRPGFGTPPAKTGSGSARDPFGTPPKTGSSGAGAPKAGTGSFAAPKTGTGPLAVPLPPGTRPGTPRAPQQTSRSLRGSLPQPPPPPAAAYQLGDFGMAPRGQSVVAKLPTGPASVPPGPPPSPPTLADGDFDFDIGAGGLELDLGSGLGPSLARKPSQPPPEDVFGERLSGPIDVRAPAKGPEVEPQLPRAVVRPRAEAPLPRRSESRRPAKKKKSVGTWLLAGPLPSVLMLLAVAALSVGAVGYALDPSDPIGALARAQTLPRAEPADQVAHQEGYLHPLLRNTPRAMRAPVAAILRAQIPGVHDLPVSFAAAPDQIADCALVEHGPDTELRLARVRETGREVNATATASAEMVEHERAVRAAQQRSDLQFTRVCLVP